MTGLRRYGRRIKKAQADLTDQKYTIATMSSLQQADARLVKMEAADVRNLKPIDLASLCATFTNIENNSKKSPSMQVAPLPPLLPPGCTFGDPACHSQQSLLRAELIKEMGQYCHASTPFGFFKRGMKTREGESDRRAMTPLQQHLLVGFVLHQHLLVGTLSA